ncbi:hypothetical protein PENSPDRAFT_430182 [Peniophora sp. CONT]|nr:hypothetical protein PENSPDRAFT_430182 [Peniophora sp. CONT]
MRPFRRTPNIYPSVLASRSSDIDPPALHAWRSRNRAHWQSAAYQQRPITQSNAIVEGSRRVEPRRHACVRHPESRWSQVYLSWYAHPFKRALRSQTRRYGIEMSVKIMWGRDMWAAELGVRVCTMIRRKGDESMYLRTIEYLRYLVLDSTTRPPCPVRMLHVEGEDHDGRIAADGGSRGRSEPRECFVTAPIGSCLVFGRSHPVFPVLPRSVRPCAQLPFRVRNSVGIAILDNNEACTGSGEAVDKDGERGEERKLI